MAAYAQYGYGYPTANQYLTSPELAVSTTTSSAATPNATPPAPPQSTGRHHHNPESSSPLSDTATPNASSLSPSHSHERDSGGVCGRGDDSAASSSIGGTLTPDDATSQNSLTPGGNFTQGSGTPHNNNNINGGGSANPYQCTSSFAATPLAGVTPCCDNGRPMMTDPVSGQTVCSCQYDTAHFALSSYTRMQNAAVAAAVGVYGATYNPATASETSPYGSSIGVDAAANTVTANGHGGNVQPPATTPTATATATAFYTSLSNPYGLKDSTPNGDISSSSPASWTSAGLQPTAGYYTYDPTFGAYGYGAGYDLAARRKNATRESTATLKAWLNEHKKNPYPTKGEKIMLAIITKMTLTQVSTWFANARRRLKKENKMTWEPKNRSEDDDDALVSEEELDKERDRTQTPIAATTNATSPINGAKRFGSVVGGGGSGAIIAAGNGSSTNTSNSNTSHNGRSSEPIAGVMETAAPTIGVGTNGVVGVVATKDPLRAGYYQAQYHHHNHHHQQQQHPHTQPFSQPHLHQLQPTNVTYGNAVGLDGQSIHQRTPYRSYLSDGHHHYQAALQYGPVDYATLKEDTSGDAAAAAEAKPKIWSLADTAAELVPKTPIAFLLNSAEQRQQEWLTDYGGSVTGPPPTAGYQAELVATIAMQSTISIGGVGNNTGTMHERLYTPPPLPPSAMGAGQAYRGGRMPVYGAALPTRLQHYEERIVGSVAASRDSVDLDSDLERERELAFKRQHCA